MLGLCLRARKRNPVGVTILVKSSTDNHPMNRITVLKRSGKPLQEHHPRSFTANEAISRRVERLALAVRRQHRSLRKADESAWRNH